jgi:hypothetical protein
MNDVTDQHTVYFWCENMNSEEVYQELTKSVFALRDKHGLDYTNTKLVVKVIDKCVFHYGYAWVEDSSLYNCMVGKHPDGSSRTSRVYPQPLSEYEDRLCLPSSWNTMSFDEQWGLLEDFYQNSFSSAIETLDRYESNSFMQDLPSLFEVEKIRNFEGARVNPDKGVSNILVCYNPPKNIDLVILRDMFAMHVSNPNFHLFNKRTKVNTYFPIVTEDKRRRVIHVEFAPRSTDGYFALLMNKVCIMPNCTKLYFVPKDTRPF